MKTLALVLVLILSACGKEGVTYPDVSHWYHCEPGAHGESASYTTIVVATSNCVPVN